MSSKQPQASSGLNLDRREAALQDKISNYIQAHQGSGGLTSGETGSTEAKEQKAKLADMLSQVLPTLENGTYNAQQKSWEEFCHCLRQTEDKWAKYGHSKQLVNPKSKKKPSLHTLIGEAKALVIERLQRPILAEPPMRREIAELVTNNTTASMMYRDQDNNVYQRMNYYLLMTTLEDHEMRGQELKRIALDVPNFADLDETAVNNFTGCLINKETLQGLHESFERVVANLNARKTSSDLSEGFEHRPEMSAQERCYLPDRIPTHTSPNRLKNLSKLNALIVYYEQNNDVAKLEVAKALRDSMQGRLALHKVVAIERKNPEAIGENLLTKGKLATIFDAEMAHHFPPEEALIALEKARAVIASSEALNTIFNQFEQWLMTGELYHQDSVVLGKKLNTLIRHYQGNVPEVSAFLDKLGEFIHQASEIKKDAKERCDHYRDHNDEKHREKANVAEALSAFVQNPGKETLDNYRKAKEDNPNYTAKKMFSTGDLAKLVKRVDLFFSHKNPLQIRPGGVESASLGKVVVREPLEDLTSHENSSISNDDERRFSDDSSDDDYLQAHEQANSLEYEALESYSPVEFVDQVGSCFDSLIIKFEEVDRDSSDGQRFKQKVADLMQILEDLSDSELGQQEEFSELIEELIRCEHLKQEEEEEPTLEFKYFADALSEKAPELLERLLMTLKGLEQSIEDHENLQIVPSIEYVRELEGPLQKEQQQAGFN